MTLSSHAIIIDKDALQIDVMYNRCASPQALCRTNNGGRKNADYHCAPFKHGMQLDK